MAMIARGAGAGAVLVAAILALAAPAAAHPHVFVDAKAEIVFDAEGRIAAIRNIWRFDEAFSSYATLNLDADGDGNFSDAELEPLAKVNVDSLHEYDFFTYLSMGGEQVAFDDVTDYLLTYDGTQATLYYTLPLLTPLVVSARAQLEVYDPEYFVAFSFVTDNPATLIDAPPNCAATFHPPQTIDDATMATLNALPADQRELPPELSDAAMALANSITIDCVARSETPLPVAAEAPRARPPSPFGVGTVDTTTGSGWLTRGPLGPFFVQIAAYQAQFYKAMTGSFADIKENGWAAWFLLGLSFLYGIFHAAGPGHGKAVITSYLFATGESVRRGIVISFISAFVQAFTAIAVVVVAAVIFRAAASTMTMATVWIEVASYALIVLVGLWLLWSKTFGGGHHHHHHHHVEPVAADPTHRPSGGPPSPFRGGMGASHSAVEHGHDHGHDHEHGHDHSHHDHGHHHGHSHAADAQAAPVRARPSRAGLISAVLAVGIRPCSGAIIVLVFALSQGMLAVGIASTLVMAVGTGLTVAALATLAVSAHGFATRLAGADNAWGYRAVRGLEILAALAVLVLGLVLLGGALATVQMPG